MYISPDRLRSLVITARQTGIVSYELTLAVFAIARNIWRREGRWLDVEDFTQDCVLHVLAHLDRIDLDRPAPAICGWVVALCRDVLWRETRRLGHDRRLLNRYGIHLGGNCPAI